ncbi:MAG: excinuclease ABC subunit B [Phycisphaerae bacterium]|nr:excinuclease ABC subunit B [Phycisphaerae bacterium]MBM90378.1 excinuclease ABC subunit B [Phycisphaerae bacterium]
MPIDSTKPFEVVSDYQPAGDQPEAIAGLASAIESGQQHSCLLGATGTGKTYTMAHTIAKVNKPTLVLSHNKTLAAQLFEEFKEFFPHNSVNYFVSYYDYYQPEAYIPGRDIYIEKDSARNDDLDQLRLAATSNLIQRRDCIVVASVSCIFGLGSPSAYGEKVYTIMRGMNLPRRELFLALNAMRYERAEIDFMRGTYRARGDAIEVWPAYEKFAIRIELFGDEVERIELINPTSGELLAEESQYFLFPAVHYVMPEDRMSEVLKSIREEMDARVMHLRHEGKLLEAQRLLARTKYDLEMIEEVGYCQGVENYSRYMDGRLPGERPFTLLDYFDYAPGRTSRDREGADMADQTPPSRSGLVDSRDHEMDAARFGIERTNLKDWMIMIDESHVTIPQIRAMFNGDKARKEVLVEHGFRLPSCLDNRPLRFEEFEALVPQVVYVSATPGPYELEQTQGEVIEQVIRPTGLVDPEIEVRPASGQVPDLLERCTEVVAQGSRVLVTALTKRLCEDLTTYMSDQGLRVRYLHSDIDTLERVEILTDLRRGEFDVLIGVNLLREGLDLPEVALVCILDADKEGFLRSATALIQQIGRAARNADSKVILYADKVTKAMSTAMDETERRRAKQIEYNTEHDIVPVTIHKAIRGGIENILKARKTAKAATFDEADDPPIDAAMLVKALETDMLEAAEATDFESAAMLRDQMQHVQELIEQHQTDAVLDGDEDLMLRRSEVARAIGARGHKPGSANTRRGKPRTKR